MEPSPRRSVERGDTNLPAAVDAAAAAASLPDSDSASQVASVEHGDPNLPAAASLPDSDSASQVASVARKVFPGELPQAAASVALKVVPGAEVVSALSLKEAPDTRRVTHIFVCHGPIDSWPTMRDHPFVSAISDAVNSRWGWTVRRPPSVVMFDSGDSGAFNDGDVIIFPHMVVYRSLSCSDVDNFFEAILVKCTGWKEGENLKGGFAFICCDPQFRHCSTCGPLVLSKLNNEIVAQNLEGLVQAFACTHTIMQSKFEVMMFRSDGLVWQYTKVNPRTVRQLLSYHFGDRSLYEPHSEHFTDFWIALLTLSEAGDDLDSLLSTRSKFRLQAEAEPEAMLQLVMMIRDSANELQDIIRALCVSSSLCEPGVMDLEWRPIVAWQINKSEKTIYSFARSVRDTVVAEARLAPYSPTETEQRVQFGLDIVEALLRTGKDLGWFVQTFVGGKAYRPGKVFLQPIWGISRPAWENDFCSPKEEAD